MHFILYSDEIIQKAVKCNLNSFYSCQIFWSIIIHALDCPSYCLVLVMEDLKFWIFRKFMLLLLLIRNIV